MYHVGINKGIILRCTAYQISRTTSDSYVFESLREKYISIAALNKTTEEEILSDCKHYRLPARDAVQPEKNNLPKFLKNAQLLCIVQHGVISQKKTLYCDTKEYRGSVISSLTTYPSSNISPLFFTQ